jgi:hypothetical protein
VQSFSWEEAHGAFRALDIRQAYCRNGLVFLTLGKKELLGLE